MEQILSGVGVFDKAMSIVGVLESGPRPLTELVDATGLSRATTHRLAVALEQHGLVGRDGDGRFRLGARLVVLGQRAAEMAPLADLARPVLAALRDCSGESVQLYVRQGNHRLCVVALDSPHELRTIVEPGAVLPLGIGSAGRILAGEPTGPEGWTESVEDRAPGVASVSAPVADASGAVVAAISVSGPIDRIGSEPGHRHGAAVVDAAHRIGDLAGHNS